MGWNLLILATGALGGFILGFTVDQRIRMALTSSKRRKQTGRK